MFLGLPLGASRINEWLAPVFDEGEEILHGEHGAQAYALFGIDGVLILASVTIATIGLILAWRLFGVELGPHPHAVAAGARPRAHARELPFLYRASLNKWWFDELNHLLFMVIGGRIAAAIWWFDREVVDGTVNAIGAATVGAGPRPAPGPDRPRPELRPGHRHRADRHGRLVPPAGGRLMMDLGSIPILTIVTFLPLVGAILVAIAPASAARPLALGTALVTFVVSLILLVGYLPGRRGLPVRRDASTGSRSSASSTSSAPTGCRSRSSC